MKDMKFPFSDTPNTACFTCRHVLEENRPIRYVSHDEDGYWQFLCGGGPYGGGRESGFAGIRLGDGRERWRAGGTGLRGIRGSG